MILVQTNTMNVALIPNPITVVIKFIPEPVITKSLNSQNPNWKNMKNLQEEERNGMKKEKRMKNRDWKENWGKE